MSQHLADDFTILIRDCETLIAMLKDPHPGLFTWQAAVQNVRKRIWEYESPERLKVVSSDHD
jgi:hypothetical protein